jgi:biopolymer transport protein ExbD
MSASPRGRDKSRLRSRWRTRSGSAIALNLTAMIDVVFLLMIYFMLAMNFTEQERSLELDVVEESQQQSTGDPFALPTQPIMILVRSSGDAAQEYQLATDSPVLGAVGSADELVRSLQAARGNALEADQPFVISPQTTTRWEHTVAAVSAVRRGGFTRVRMAAPALETAP